MGSREGKGVVMASQGTTSIRGGTSPYFMFLHGKRWLPSTHLQLRRDAARRNGIEYVYERDRSTGGYVSYMKAPIGDHEENVELMRAVLGELGL